MQHSLHRSEGPDKAKKNPQFHPDFVYFPYLQNATKGFNFASKICVKVTMNNLLLIFMVKLILEHFFTEICLQIVREKYNFVVKNIMI